MGGAGYRGRTNGIRDTKALASFILWTGRKFKGKGAIDGLRFDFQRDLVEFHGYENFYIGLDARKCASLLLKCGGPGAEYWVSNPKRRDPPEPPFGKMSGYCTGGGTDGCVMN